MLLLCQDAVAQTFPQTSWWTLEPARFNPAVSAQAYTLSGTSWFRKQWSGLEGSPTTLGVTLVSPIYRFRSGVALSVENDRIGAFSTTVGRVSGAFSVLRKRNLDISAGAGVSYRTAQLAGDQLRTDDGEYGPGAPNHKDPLLDGSAVSATSFGVDAGLSVKIRETEVGVSALNLNAPVGEYATFVRTWPRTFTAFAKTTLPLAERLDLQLGALLLTDQRISQLHTQAFLWYDGNIGAGAAFRGWSANTTDAICLLLGWRASSVLTFAYAYDAGLSALNTVHTGSHELSVRFALTEPLGQGRPPPVIFSPRL